MAQGVNIDPAQHHALSKNKYIYKRVVGMFFRRRYGDNGSILAYADSGFETFAQNTLKPFLGQISRCKLVSYYTKLPRKEIPMRERETWG